MEVVKTLNPATLLPINTRSLEHDCLEVMDEVFSSLADLTDQPISNPDVEYFTDGSSFVQDSTCFAGYAVVTLDSVIEAHKLLVGTSAQKAELWLSCGPSSSLQEYRRTYILILNMLSQPFMFTELCIKKGNSLTWEEKVSSTGRKSLNC
jgi:hypothetical protein